MQKKELPSNTSELQSYESSSNNYISVKPFVKWVGGKNQLINIISDNYPSELGKSIKKYAEPFVGGGAILFNVLSNYSLDEVYISDKNRELITTYQIIKNKHEDLIISLLKIQNEYHGLSLKKQKDYFYEKRNYFNEIKNKNYNFDCIEIASFFIFLNKTCFNGLYRVNKFGGFNVPIGSYKNPLICDKYNITAASNVLQNVIIKNCDYYESEKFIDESTFVYFDPPYRPLNTTSRFTSYNEFDFDDNSQKQLALYFDKLNDKKAKIMLSNSDPKNINPQDDFFDIIYDNFNILRVKANRNVNCNKDLRGQITEILVKNY